MKSIEIDRVKISHVCQPMLGMKNSFHINFGSISKTKPGPTTKGKINPK